MKWGIVGITKGLARDFAAKGIIVNGIVQVFQLRINGTNTAENAGCTDTLDGRVALPEKIAEIALFLASDTANYIIGQIVVWDGGESII